MPPPEPCPPPMVPVSGSWRHHLNTRPLQTEQGLMANGFSFIFPLPPFDSYRSTPFLMFFKTSFFSTTCSYFPVGAVIISHHHGYYESLSWGLCFQPCPRASSTLLCSREMQLIISFSLNPFFLPSDFRKSPNLLTWLI